MSDVFWSNPGNLVPARAVITLDSPGDQNTGPMGSLPGTTAGAIPTVYTTEAQRVYPWNLDFTGKQLDQYNDFVANRFQQFSSWHSLYQAKYIREQGEVMVPSADPSSTRPDAYYILLSDDRTVLNVMSLSVSDYQRLSKADRDKLELVDAFKDFVAGEQSLTKDKSAVTSLITDVRGKITAATNMPQADRDVFDAQLKMLERRLAEATRVVTGTYQKEIAAIADRFNRARVFVGQKDELTMTTTFQQTENDYYRAVLKTDVRGYTYSTDSGQTVRNGYTNMMRAEREILTAQLRREAVARNTTVYDPKRDAASLIYLFQLQYQSEATARSDAGTEEMAQLHRLLSDYAIMQRLVNETLKAYNPKETDEKRRFMNIGAFDSGSVEQEQRLWSNQNYQIKYTWKNSAGTVVDSKTLGTDGSQNGFDYYYDEAPRFHWYQLAGTFRDQRIGDGRIGNYTASGSFENWYDFNGDGSFNGDVYDYFRDRGDVYVRAGGLNETEMRVVGMFSKDPWGSGIKYQAHPIELLYSEGADRPLQAFSDDSNKGKGGLALQRRDYWDKFGTQLSDRVTILNQKNQLKQNEIDNDSKQGNRHFDLGNNALKKMNEMLMSIGRL